MKPLIEKDKVVVFELTDKMSLPVLVGKGYQRAEVEELFEELEKAGYGLYTRGRRGRTGAATFEAFYDGFSPRLPATFTLTVKVKRLHNSYAGQPRTVQTENGAVEVAASAVSAPVGPIGTAIAVTSPGATEYVVIVEDNRLVCEKVAVGAKTIEQALRVHWNDVGNRVAGAESMQGQEMTLIEGVASRLRGCGVCELLPE